MSEHLPDVDIVYCSFCGISNRENSRGAIVVAGTANICNLCISTCMQSIAEQLAAVTSRLAKPAHEREPPHCSSCSCGMPSVVARQQMTAVDRCKHGNPIDPTGGYVCMKCFNEWSTTQTTGEGHG